MSERVLQSPQGRRWWTLWRGLPRRHPLVPLKSALRLEAVGPLAGWLFVYEWGNEDFYVRLFGTELATLLGADETRKWISQLYPETVVTDRLALLERCVSEPEAVFTQERIRLADEPEWRRFEYVLAPLTDDAGVVRYLAGTIAEIGEHRRLRAEWSGSPLALEHDPASWRIGVLPLDRVGRRAAPAS